MLARRAVQLLTTTQRKFVSPTPKFVVARYMGHDATPKTDNKKGDVVIPELVDTLEWVLDSPPNVHQFDEPPIIVEIEHLKNLKGPSHH